MNEQLNRAYNTYEMVMAQNNYKSKRSLFQTPEYYDAMVQILSEQDIHRVLLENTLYWCAMASHDGWLKVQLNHQLRQLAIMVFNDELSPLSSQCIDDLKQCFTSYSIESSIVNDSTSNNNSIETVALHQTIIDGLNNTSLQLSDDERLNKTSSQGLHKSAHMTSIGQNCFFLIDLLFIFESNLSNSQLISFLSSMPWYPMNWSLLSLISKTFIDLSFDNQQRICTLLSECLSSTANRYFNSCIKTIISLAKQTVCNNNQLSFNEQQYNKECCKNCQIAAFLEESIKVIIRNGLKKTESARFIPLIACIKDNKVQLEYARAFLMKCPEDFVHYLAEQLMSKGFKEKGDENIEHGGNGNCVPGILQSHLDDDSQFEGSSHFGVSGLLLNAQSMLTEHGLHPMNPKLDGSLRASLLQFYSGGMTWDELASLLSNTTDSQLRTTDSQLRTTVLDCMLQRVKSKGCADLQSMVVIDSIVGMLEDADFEIRQQVVLLASDILIEQLSLCNFMEGELNMRQSVHVESSIQQSVHVESIDVTHMTSNVPSHSVVNQMDYSNIYNCAVDQIDYSNIYNCAVNQMDCSMPCNGAIQSNDFHLDCIKSLTECLIKLTQDDCRVVRATLIPFLPLLAKAINSHGLGNPNELLPNPTLFAKACQPEDLYSEAIDFVLDPMPAAQPIDCY